MNAFADSPGRYRVRDFVLNFIGDRGYSPTYKEIAAALGLRSLATVHKHVHRLAREGEIEIQAPDASRGFGHRFIAIPGKTRATCPKCHYQFEIKRGKA